MSKKKIKELTVGELNEYLKDLECDNCPFKSKSGNCVSAQCVDLSYIEPYFDIEIEV